MANWVPGKVNPIVAIMVGNNNSSYQYTSTGKSGETLSVTFNNGKIGS